MRGATWIDRGSCSSRSAKPADVVRVGGGEQQVLALRRQQLDDLADVVDEAHVEHAIGFIEHQHLHLGEIHAALLREVEQPAGRRHQDVAAAAQGGDLRIDAHAAEHLVGAQLHVLAVVARALGHLRGELAGRRQHQRTRRAAGAVRLIGGEALQNGQHETGGFAGAGLGAGEHIAAGKHGGNRLQLNGGRRVVALIGDSTQQFGQKPEIGK